MTDEENIAKEQLPSERGSESVYGLQSCHLGSVLVIWGTKFANRFVSNVFSGCPCRRMRKGTFEAAGYSNDVSLKLHKRTF